MQISNWFFSVLPKFCPTGRICGKDDFVQISPEEAEALRLKNIVGLDQTAAAKKMKVSQSTFQRVLSSAYKKVSEALVMAKEIIESGKFDAVKNKLKTMQAREKQRLGAAPDWAIGSVHAVTEDGKVLIASATGSQLPAYAYGANHVVWIVGAQKLVKNFEDGLKRLYEYSLPLEDVRARKVYGAGSSVNKILIVNKEPAPERITMIIVKEKLGF